MGMAIKSKKNYYDILGVTPDTNINEVKASYRRLARKYHPDVNKEAGSEDKFKDVCEAYETLSNETKRKQYDMLNGFYKKPQQKVKKEEAPKTKQPPPPQQKSHYEDDFEEFDEFEDFDEPETTPKENHKEEKTENKKTEKHDNYTSWFFRKRVDSILDEISKNHNKEKNFYHEPKDGNDVNTDISISFTEAISGTERILNIMHKELCPHCQGRKFINGAKCPKCGGSGIFEERRKITVKVPAGVKNNAKLRLPGEGNPGFYGGKNGNLYIRLNIEPDKNLKIEGNNILYNLPISPFEAVLGGEIEIPSFGGNIKFTLPSMTNSGQQFRIAKKGLKTNGNFGDMIITVEIQLPTDLSDDEVSMYAKLKKMSKCSVREQE